MTMPSDFCATQNFEEMADNNEKETPYVLEENPVPQPNRPP